MTSRREVFSGQYMRVAPAPRNMIAVIGAAPGSLQDILGGCCTIAFGLVLLFTGDTRQRMAAARWGRQAVSGKRGQLVYRVGPSLILTAGLAWLAEAIYAALR